MYFRLVAAALLVFWSLEAYPASAESPFKDHRILIDGVSVFRFEPDNLPQPNIVSVIDINPGSEIKLELVEAEPGTGGEPASVLCARVSCLAAVNGGFFSIGTGRPVNGGSPEVRDVLGIDVPGTESAIVVHEDDPAPPNHPGFTDVLQPRTLVCDNADPDAPPTGEAKRWLITIDGRQAHSRGMTVTEAVAIVSRLGCTRTVNLDGGCSTTLVVESQVENYPCPDQAVLIDGKPQRKLANIVAVVHKNPPPPDPTPPPPPPATPEPETVVQINAETPALRQLPEPVVPSSSSRSPQLMMLAIMLVLTATLLASWRALRLTPPNRPAGPQGPAGLSNILIGHADPDCFQPLLGFHYT